MKSEDIKQNEDIVTIQCTLKIMSNKSFFIVLPSNSNPHIFPNNSSSKYSIEFDNPIYLSGQYEVSLIEMTYKNDIMALKDNSFRMFALKVQDKLFQLMKNKSPLNWDYNWIKIESIEMEEGTGYDPDFIWDLFHEIRKFVTLGIDQNAGNKVYIKVKKDDVLLVISKGIATMFNFSRTSFSNKDEDEYSDGMQRKEYVKNWTISLVPLYALNYRRIILKKKGEMITLDELMKRWKKKICDKCVTLTVDSLNVDEKKTLQEQLPLVVKMRKLRPLKGEDWCVFQVEDVFKKDMLPDKHPFLANEDDEISFFVRPNNADKFKDHEWAVRVYNNSLKKTFISNEEYVVDDVVINLEKIASVNNLLDALNVKSVLHDYKFTYDALTNRISLTIPPFHRIKLDDVLASVIGFTTSLNLKEQKQTASKSPMLKRNVSNLFVYTNIIDFIHVGNTEAPLLRQFSISSHTHALINREFFTKIFIPVNRNILDRIDISIHDQAGDLVPFKDGMTTITLEFRPIVL